MNNIKIYTIDSCPFCVRALELLNKLNLKYQQIKVTDQKIKEKMLQEAKGRTYPQIIINNEAIGGCDDLYELYEQNELNKLLK